MIAAQERKACSIEGCGRVARARGLCGTHYMRRLRTGSTSGRVRAPVIERFWSKVIPGDGGCLIWIGAYNKVKGRPAYGVFKVDGKQVYAHIFAWELAHGPKPPGTDLDHRVCRRKGCVNEAHLALCTPLENFLQPDGAGVVEPMRRLAKTHCPHGHPWDQ